MKRPLDLLLGEADRNRQAWIEARGIHGSAYCGEWDFALTAPGSRFDRSWLNDMLGTTPARIKHRPSILERGWNNDDRDITREAIAVCLICGWVDDRVFNNLHGSVWNLAAEAAHDHAWPGWRELPLLERDSAEVGKLSKQLIEKLDALYPEAWRPLLGSGAPIRTLRSKLGTRHVPECNPFGGWDMCGGIKEKGEHEVTKPAEQATLF